MRRLGVLLGTVAVLALTPASALAASSGSITNAVATPDWSHVSFTVSVNGGICGTGYCSWIPVVIAQPSLPSYNCGREEFFDNDANTQSIWHGPSETANVSFTEAAANVPLLPHVTGQRLCLEIVGTVYEAWAGENLTFGESLGGAYPTVEAPMAQVEPPPAVVVTAPPASAPPMESAACGEGAAALKRSWERVTRAHAKFAKTPKAQSHARRLRRELWERAKHAAREIEEHQHKLCG